MQSGVKIFLLCFALGSPCLFSDKREFFCFFSFGPREVGLLLHCTVSCRLVECLRLFDVDVTVSVKLPTNLRLLVELFEPHAPKKVISAKRTPSASLR